ncbi:ABC transporter permease [Nesterenkonia xinjiangensis]|uniref:Putative spermidine/putrescine transport system permease protein n=1 Tax=Nesterenkonia xinjiangensis TaxID=225327 RepID=A0A7Z0GLG8_9MICC|nr:ABC transporter permease [Nesterenkonia xinjiangensis]NYJ78197.1 putative spermidine/putrescine transport system permease protein [Nesterenkonia xinjiangensis]
MLIENRLLKLLFRLFIAGVLLFISAPMLVIMVMSFNEARSLTLPVQGVTTDWYANYFQSSQWMTATVTSLQIGSLTALLTTALATLAAYALTRGTFKGKDIAYVLLITPLVVPTMVLAIAFYFYFSDLGVTGNLFTVVLGHTVITFPIVLVTISSSLQGVSANLERASMSLGASRLTTFFRVVFPLMVPGMVSGALFSFLLSFDELLVPLFLGGVGIVTLPTQIWGMLNFNFDQTISAVSTIIIVVMAFLLVLVQSLTSRTEKKRGQQS